MCPLSTASLSCSALHCACTNSLLSSLQQLCLWIILCSLYSSGFRTALFDSASAANNDICPSGTTSCKLCISLKTYRAFVCPNDCRSCQASKDLQVLTSVSAYAPKRWNIFEKPQGTSLNSFKLRTSMGSHTLALLSRKVCSLSFSFIRRCVSSKIMDKERCSPWAFKYYLDLHMDLRGGQQSLVCSNLCHDLYVPVSFLSAFKTNIIIHKSLPCILNGVHFCTVCFPICN